eukprot:gene15783-15178_t
MIAGVPAVDPSQTVHTLPLEQMKMTTNDLVTTTGTVVYVHSVEQQGPAAIAGVLAGMQVLKAGPTPEALQDVLSTDHLGAIWQNVRASEQQFWLLKLRPLPPVGIEMVVKQQHEQQQQIHFQQQQHHQLQHPLEAYALPAADWAQFQAAVAGVSQEGLVGGIAGERVLDDRLGCAGLLLYALAKVTAQVSPPHAPAGGKPLERWQRWQQVLQLGLTQQQAASCYVNIYKQVSQPQEPPAHLFAERHAQRD